MSKTCGSSLLSSVYRVKFEGQEAIYKRRFRSDNDFYGSAIEIDSLTRLKDHPNIIKLKSIDCPSDIASFMSPATKDRIDDGMNIVLEAGMASLDKVNIESEHWEELFSQCLDALAYIHANNIIHRDIKAANIILVKDPTKRSGYRFCICDFGLSKHHTLQEENSPGANTINYRAPEIAARQPYSYASDVWCMGCVFYTVVTRRLFYRIYSLEDDVLEEICNIIPSDTPVEPSSVSWMSGKKTSPPSFRLPIAKHLGINDQKIITLINNMLTFDPSRRPTAVECMKMMNYTPSPIKPFHHEDRVFRLCPRFYPIHDEMIGAILHLTTLEIPFRVIIHSFQVYLDMSFITKVDPNVDVMKIYFYIFFYVILKLISPFILYNSFIDLLPKNLVMLYKSMNIDNKQYESFLIEKWCKCLPYRKTVYEEFDKYNYRLSDPEKINLFRLLAYNKNIFGKKMSYVAEKYYYHLRHLSPSEITTVDF